MQQFSIDYLAETARQTASLSAFFGGFVAAFIGTLLLFNSRPRLASWAIGSATLSAVAFIVAVINATKVVVSLPLYTPTNLSNLPAAIVRARLLGTISFGVGIYGLLFSLGLSGWLHSKRTGIITSTFAIIGIAFTTLSAFGF